MLSNTISPNFNSNAASFFIFLCY